MQLNWIWFRVRVSESQRQTPTQTFLEFTPSPRGSLDLVLGIRHACWCRVAGDSQAYLHIACVASVSGEGRKGGGGGGGGSRSPFLSTWPLQFSQKISY